MLTDSEYKLLKKMRDLGGLDEDSLSREESETIRLISSRYYYPSPRSGRLIITRAGEIAMKEYEELLRQKEEEEADRQAQRAEDILQAEINTRKQFRHDWRIAIFETCAGFILGAVFDHFFDIVGGAVRLWLAFESVFLH